MKWTRGKIKNLCRIRNMKRQDRRKNIKGGENRYAGTASNKKLEWNRADKREE